MSELSEKIARAIKDGAFFRNGDDTCWGFDSDKAAAIIDRYLPAQPAAPLLICNSCKRKSRSYLDTLGRISEPGDHCPFLGCKGELQELAPAARPNHCPTCGAFPVDIAAALPPPDAQRIKDEVWEEAARIAEKPRVVFGTPLTAMQELAQDIAAEIRAKKGTQ